MAITVTTLAGAMGASDTVINVASATGITAPNFQTGVGIITLVIDQEKIPVLAVNGTFISVLRGWGGTVATAHVINSQVQIGLATDFVPLNEVWNTVLSNSVTYGARNQPGIFLAGLTDAIPAHVPGFYVIKSAAANLMTLVAPVAADEGNIIEIWSDALFAHTLTATALLANGTALKTTATWPALRGTGLTLRACNLVWHVLSQGPFAGPVVLS